VVEGDQGSDMLSEIHANLVRSLLGVARTQAFGKYEGKDKQDLLRCSSCLSCIVSVRPPDIPS
jgi:hypothetical protein